MTLDEALLVLTTKLHYLPNALTLALGIYLHMVSSSKHVGEDPSAGTVPLVPGRRRVDVIVEAFDADRCSTRHRGTDEKRRRRADGTDGHRDRGTVARGALRVLTPTRRPGGARTGRE